jgi:hypothetical protein
VCRSIRLRDSDEVTGQSLRKVLTLSPLICWLNQGVSVAGQTPVFGTDDHSGQKSRVKPPHMKIEPASRATRTTCGSPSGNASRLAPSRRAFGDVVRQAPTDRPALRPKPIGELNRTCPVVEITLTQGPAVHEPNDSRSAFHGVDLRMCAGIVSALHSPHDRRLIVGRWREDVRHGTHTAARLVPASRRHGSLENDVRDVTESRVGKTKRLPIGASGNMA